MATPAEKFILFQGRNFKIHSVPYSGGAASTFSVDQSATAVAVLEPASSQPTITLAAASGGLKVVTLAAGGTDLGGAVTVVIAHGITISSSKAA